MPAPPTADDKPQDNYIASLAAPAIGGAVGAAAGYAVAGAGYDGAVIGAAAAPYIAALAGKTGLFAVDWLRRMNEALRSAAAELGLGPEEFAEAS